MTAKFARAANQEIIGPGTQGIRRLDLRRAAGRETAAVVAKVHWSRTGRKSEMSNRQESANLAACRTQVFDSETPVRFNPAMASTDFGDFDVHVGNMYGKSGAIWAAQIPVLRHRCSRIILRPTGC